MRSAKEFESEADARDRARKELLNVLEKARGRLAIAIAGESKITPPPRRKQYLETADYMCRYIKTLRDGEKGMRMPRKNWTPALEALHRIPPGKGAQFLCDCLKEIVAGLDQDTS